MDAKPVLLSRPTGTSNPAGLDRVKRQAWYDVQRTDINQRVGPAEDPTHSHWLHKLHLQTSFRFFNGKIVESLPYANCYKVTLEAGATTMWCNFGTDTALQPIGARKLNQLPVGANVIVTVHEEDTTGTIVCVIPESQIASNQAMADFISQAGRSGFLVDAAHHHAASLPNASLIEDWSAGRPFDQTSEGEAGYITETGLLSFLDSFMNAQRVDEETGVWSFYTDQLLRVAGHNLQVWSAGHERSDEDDEGEINSCHAWTPYYWEALGTFEFGTRVCRDIPTDCWQRDPDFQGYAAREPCDDHQQAFYRLREFYGYLGQGYKRILALPPQACPSDIPASAEPGSSSSSSDSAYNCAGPQSCPNSELNKYTVDRIFPGVFEEDLGLTGRLAIRSAHEIILSKHVLIPASKQRKNANDTSGDGVENYKAAGHPAFGQGPQHFVEGDIPFETDDEPAQVYAAGFLDTHAYVFEWLGNHPFHYHEQDYYLPNESDLSYLMPGCATPAFEPPRFEELACHQFLRTPTAIPIKVDHRYGDVNYYPNHSYIAMLSTGGIVIGDGFGSEFKMANGEITLSAPGDIKFQAGRDVITFAGYDLIMRAKHSADLSATENDVRIKARQNLQMVTTDRCGGIVIESKAEFPACDFDGKTGEDVRLGGIVLKAPDSQVSLFSNNIVLRNEDESKGLIFIDAGWNGRIKSRAGFHERFIKHDGAALDFWYSSDEEAILAGAEWWADQVSICAPVVINNKLHVGNCTTVKGDVFIVDGHIGTTRRSAAGKVGLLSNDTADTLRTQFELHTERCEGELPIIGTSELVTISLQEETVCCSDARFSFRSVTQYRTPNFVLFENRWQQIARLTGANVNVWSEEPIDDTYPYPGAENFLGQTFRTVDTSLYDPATGLAADRGSNYEDPLIPDPQQVTLDESYLVIV